MAELSASREWGNKTLQLARSQQRVCALELEKIAIALEIFKSKNSAYPASLQELVSEILPSIPKDPMTLTDFIYVPTENAFKLYSSGRNEVDDDGNKELDEVFERPMKDILEHFIGDE